MTISTHSTLGPVATGVYAAINAVQADLARSGISKGRTANVGGGRSYTFRGIDDVYNAVGPLLAEHGLCILPRMISREVVERRSSNDTALFYVTLVAEFDFVAVADGSLHTVRTFGEAMDSGDKATNKAMSAAYKYALVETFCIPTEGDNDADATTHVVKAATAPPELLARMRDAASQGRPVFAAAWRALTAEQRASLMPHEQDLRGILSAATPATPPGDAA